jgi:hypothetical protein
MPAMEDPDGRLPRTVNRLVRAVVAGLNRAHRLGHIGNPAAWRVEALPDDDESETAVFLSPVQRKKLIASGSSEAGAIMRRLELSGARPKELAEATAADFDGNIAARVVGRHTEAILANYNIPAWTQTVGRTPVTLAVAPFLHEVWPSIGRRRLTAEARRRRLLQATLTLKFN